MIAHSELTWGVAAGIELTIELQEIQNGVSLGSLLESASFLLNVCESRIIAMCYSIRSEDSTSTKH